MCNTIAKGPRRNEWPTLIVGEPYPNKVRGTLQRVKRIEPKFLPPGYRFLRSGEEVEKTDFFWSKVNKCYLPMKDKIGGWDGLAGNVLVFIRSKGNDRVNSRIKLRL